MRFWRESIGFRGQTIRAIPLFGENFKMDFFNLSNWRASMKG
jgi:hypothetical protein